MKISMAFVILAHVLQQVSGVEVEKGEESVLLPCQFPPASVEDHALVWRRDDLKSEIIHTLVEGKDDLINQNPRYTNRTAMRADAQQTGDLGLTLQDPTFTDSGTYTCTTRMAGKDHSKTEVVLLVKEPPPPPIWPEVLPAVLVPVVLLGAVIVFLAYRTCKRQKSTADSQLEAVEVTEGSRSVLLPYKTKDLPEGFSVEWIHLQEEHTVVCVYENGQIQRDRPDAAYRDRTEMNRNQMKQTETDQLSQTDVDLSLTLGKPGCKDGGVYICIIYNKDRKA